MAKKQAFYTKTVHAPPKKQAVGTPVGKVETPGVFLPPMVPLHPGRTHALGPQLRQPHPGPHGYGHVGKQRSGHYRLSGVPGAHRVGKGLKVPPQVK